MEELDRGGCRCEARTADGGHVSCCAVHNEPAYPAGPCDCRARERRVLEMARHELTTLHGLIAADGMAPAETWQIDTCKTVAEIDAVLSESSRKDSPPS
jgi:hypothetical protein